MDEFVTAADANSRFTQLLRGVREGHSYVVTSHGRPVARLGPIPSPANTTAQARERLLSRLEQQPVTKVERWTRNELYDRGT